MTPAERAVLAMLEAWPLDAMTPGLWRVYRRLKEQERAGDASL